MHEGCKCKNTYGGPPEGSRASLVFVAQQRSIWLTVISSGFKEEKCKQTSPEASVHTTRLPPHSPLCALIGGQLKSKYRDSI